MSEVSSASYQMSQCGYVIGGFVRPKKLDDLGAGACPLWEITAMGDKFATIEATGVHIDEPKYIEYLDLKEQYSVSNQKPQLQVKLVGATPEENKQWLIKYAEAQIYFGLNVLSHQTFEDNTYEGLKVYTNPNAVMATKDFEVGGLILAPVTMAIKNRVTGIDCPERNIDLGQLIQSPPVSFSLQPQLVTNKGKEGGNFIPPFWAVPMAANIKTGLMSFRYEEIRINIKGTGKDLIKEDVVLNVPVLWNPTQITAGSLLNYSKKEHDKIFKTPPNAEKIRAKKMPRPLGKARSAASASSSAPVSAPSPKASPKPKAK